MKTFSTILKEVNNELSVFSEDKKRVISDYSVATRIQNLLREVDNEFTVRAEKGYLLKVSYKGFPLFLVKAKRKRLFMELTIVSISLDGGHIHERDKTIKNLAYFVKSETERRTKEHNKNKEIEQNGFIEMLEEHNLSLDDFNKLRKCFNGLSRGTQREIR